MPASLPEGFEEITGSEVDGYFDRAAEGAWVQGKITKHKKFTDAKGEEREQFHMLLTHACEHATVRAETGEWLRSELPEGSLIGVDAVANLKCLSRYVSKPVEVFIAVEGKVKLANKREAWQFTKGVRPVAPSDGDDVPHTAGTEGPPHTAHDDESDIPF
jgi:hypothetical protein